MSLIVSHRGGALLWPENSVVAFEQSLQAGVDALECDVHLSSDGIPMVIHDATLDRTTTMSGPVRDQPAETLRRVALKGHSAATIPSLEDVAMLLRGGSQGLQVEIKGDGQFELLDRCLSTLDATAIRQQASIIAFDAAIAGRAIQAGGLGEVVWLFSASHLQHIGPSGVIAAAALHQVTTVETDVDTMSAELADMLRAAGLRLGVWGANSTAQLKKAFALKLDLVATDDPVTALKLRAQ